MRANVQLHARPGTSDLDGPHSVSDLRTAAQGAAVDPARPGGGRHHQRPRTVDVGFDALVSDVDSRVDLALEIEDRADLTQVRV